MDMQKEEDDFNAWFNKQTINAVPDADLSLQRLWASLAWQAAKSQAVPEGFVLVPKEPTKEYKDMISKYLDELWMGEWGCDWDGFICANGIDVNHVWKIVTDTKAMIEAQEPK